MASFWGALKKIGSVLVGIEHMAAPIAAGILPQFSALILNLDSLVQKTQAAILTAEANHPTDGQGQLKQDAVIADFEAGLEVAQQMAALRKKTIVYDQQALKDSIAGFVAGYNNLAKVKTSMHEVDAPPAP